MDAPPFAELFDLDTDPEMRRQILGYFLAEIMTDRERAKLMGLPEGCRIRERAKILCPEKFTCGKNVWIGEGAVLDAQGGLSIGDYTQIGLNVMVWSHSSHHQAIQGETGVTREHIAYKATSIGERCFIAGPSVILPGVKIGNAVIVAPMSVVQEDIPDQTIFRGDRGEIRQLKRKIESLEKRLDELCGRPTAKQP